jgi:translation initiation factor 1
VTLPDGKREPPGAWPTVGHGLQWRHARKGNPMNNRLVYATGTGRLCPECTRPLTECRCKRSKPAQAAPAPAGDGIVRVGRETKGRKGKGVTVIKGVPLAGDELEALATKLKKRCGCGGTVEAGTIEIQGDHRDLLLQELGKLGYTVRKSGG